MSLGSNWVEHEEVTRVSPVDLVNILRNGYPSLLLFGYFSIGSVPSLLELGFLFSLFLGLFESINVLTHSSVGFA